MSFFSPLPRLITRRQHVFQQHLFWGTALWKTRRKQIQCPWAMPQNFARRAGLLQLSPGCNAVPWEGQVSPRVSFKWGREDDAPQKIIRHQHKYRFVMICGYCWDGMKPSIYCFLSLGRLPQDSGNCRFAARELPAVLQRTPVAECSVGPISCKNIASSMTNGWPHLF